MINSLVAKWKKRKIDKFIKVADINNARSYLSESGNYTIEIKQIAIPCRTVYLSNLFIKELAKINGNIYFGAVQTELPSNTKYQYITIKGKI